MNKGPWQQEKKHLETQPHLCSIRDTTSINQRSLALVRCFVGNALGEWVWYTVAFALQLVSLVSKVPPPAPNRLVWPGGPQSSLVETNKQSSLKLGSAIKHEKRGKKTQSRNLAMPISVFKAPAFSSWTNSFTDYSDTINTNVPFRKSNNTALLVFPVGRQG